MLEELKPKTMAELQADYTALASQAGDKGFQVAVWEEEIKLIHKAMLDLQKDAKALSDKVQTPEVVTEIPSDALLAEDA